MEAKDKICKLIEKLNAAAPKTIGTTPVRWNDNVFNVEMNGSDISTLIEILDKLSQMPSDKAFLEIIRWFDYNEHSDNWYLEQLIAYKLHLKQSQLKIK